MEQNKTRSYILYALGEVLLVVLGILIALQVNNWNENRVLNKERVELLLNLKSDFQESSSRVVSQLESTEKKNTDLKNILAYSAGSEVEIPPDSLHSMLQNVLYAVYYNSYFTTFDQAKSSGKLSLLKNKELLEALSDLEATVVGLLNSQDVYIKRITGDDYRDMFARLSMVNVFENESSPVVHPELALEGKELITYIRTPEVYSRLYHFYSNRLIFASWANGVKRDLTQVLNEIEKSLSH